MALNAKYEDLVDAPKIATIGEHRHPGEILKLASNQQLRPAVDDATRRLLIIIDMQNDFMEGGSLAVPGATADVERLTRWMYANLEGITAIMCSIDTHYPLQIFHPAMWADAKGNPPADYTMITYDDVAAGKWRVVNGSATKAQACLKALAGTGKVGVMVWPYHCLIGSDGWKLEQELDNLVLFHSAVRRTRPQLVFKGTDTYSEMYGIIEPEYNPEGFVNYDVLNAIAQTDTQGDLKVNYDEIYLAGEAASHCLLESGAQILRHFKDHPEVTQRITILEDCTSPITGYEQATRDAFDEFKRSYGIQVRKSTDVQLV
jgi:nicotinamidase-related amidase